MARTKKKRNYKKAPKNTRVFRCVQKVKKKQEIGAAIAICQSSTKQSYRTGKSLKEGRRKKKTRKKRGGCGKDEVFWPDIHFNELESILRKLQKDTAGTTLGEMVDNLPSISKNKGECHGCKELINELVLNTMPPTRILPIENKNIIWLRRFTGVHKGRACTIMGGRRKKKTRKKRGGNGHTGDWYHITNSNGESFYGGVIAHEENNSIVLLIADGDTEFQWNSNFFRKDNLSFSDPITNMDSIAPASNDALSIAIEKMWPNKGDDDENYCEKRNARDSST